MNTILITVANDVEYGLAVQVFNLLHETSDYDFSWTYDDFDLIDENNEWEIFFDDTYEYHEQHKIEDIVQAAFEDVAEARL